jgi:hypothetical protein
MITGELDHILRTLLDTAKDDVSRQETLDLFKKIEDDATEICQKKYELHEVIKFGTTSGNKDSTTSLGRQSFKSLDCIRLSIKKNLTVMNESVRPTFQSYLSKCGY